MILWLCLTAVFLMLVIIFQTAKILEYISVLKGEKEVTEGSNRMNGALLLVMMILGLAGAVWSAWKFAPYYLPRAASMHGVWIDEMFNVTLIITGIVFFLTEILLFYYGFRYKKLKNTKALFYPDNHKIEIIWTAIPAVVLTALVAFGAMRWWDITGPAPEDSVVVEATGSQFAWVVRYPGKDGKLGQRDYKKITGSNFLGIVASDEAGKDDIIQTSELHLPVNKNVLVKIRARDVLHSFYLPHFRVKMDAVPGIPTQFWFRTTITTAEQREVLGKPAFNFELACAELCGKGHSAMRMVVVVETEEEYNKWLAGQKTWGETMLQTAEMTQ